MPYNSLTQGESLKGWQYKAVRTNGTDFQVTKCDANSDSLHGLGILLDDPDTDEAGVSVSAPGDLPCRAMVGATVAAGDLLIAPNAASYSGKLQKATAPGNGTTDTVIIARALQSGTDGAIILVMPMHLPTRSTPA